MHGSQIMQDLCRHLLPPEELLDEVVRLRLSAPISLLTRVRRSVDMLFLTGRETQGGRRLNLSHLHLIKAGAKNKPAA